jgi:hypothetical protein
MEKVQIDIGELTLGEMEAWEELTGEPFGVFLAACESGLERLPTRYVSALVVVLQRRENPDYSLEDARRLRASDVEPVEADPTPAAGTSANGRRSRTTSA